MKNSVLHIIHSIFYLVLILITTTGYSQSLADGTIVSAGSRIKYGVTGLEGSVFQWTLYGPDNSVILNASSTDSLEIDFPCQPGDYTLQVQENTEFNCDGAPVTATIEVEPLEVSFEDNEIGLCFGDQYIMSPVIRFDNNKPLSYEWIQVGQGSTVGNNIDLEVTNNDTLDQLRTDQLAFRATYQRPGVRCIESDTAMVMKYPLNRINMEDQIKICDKDPRYLYPGDYAIYDWSTGDMSDQIQVEAITRKDSSRTIWVDVTDFYGCEYSDTIVILACNVQEILENIPNAFSPGNEKGGWVIEELEQFPGARLEIFDRWGRLVFSTDDATTDFWDGTYKGKLLPADSYYYVIDLNTPDQEEPVAGSVSLVY